MIPPRLGRVGAALALLWAIASANVFWVGSATIYSPDLAGRRDVLHRAVLTGQLPPGVSSWTELGANSAALRPAVPRLAEWMASATGLGLGMAYRLIEFVSIVIALVALFLILRRWFPTERALIGCLYLGCVLPLSYSLHYFHPWDKPGLALWLVAAGLMLANAVILSGVAICMAVVVKFDAVVLPVLYMLLHGRRHRMREFAARSVFLWMAAVVPFLTLRWLRPGAAETRNVVTQFLSNLDTFRETWYAYPPMIGLLLPVALGAFGLKRSSGAERAMYFFALAVLGILAAMTNFAEIRAEFAPLAFMLPCALRGLGRAVA